MVGVLSFILLTLHVLLVNHQGPGGSEVSVVSVSGQATTGLLPQTCGAPAAV